MKLSATEAAALAASTQVGRGDEDEADRAAVDSMRKTLNSLDINGTVVIGEGERDEAPMLYIGEKVGSGDGPEVDIALDLRRNEHYGMRADKTPWLFWQWQIKAVFECARCVHEKLAIGAGVPIYPEDLDAPIINVLERAQPKPKADDSGFNGLYS